MKKLLLFLILLFAANAFSQTINDTPLKDIDVEYIEIVGTSKLFSNKVTVELDFGQKTSFFNTGAETVLRGEDGKAINFNSMIDALNYMVKNGYEFVQAYAITLSQQNVYHYLLRKKR